MPRHSAPVTLAAILIATHLCVFGLGAWATRSGPIHFSGGSPGGGLSCRGAEIVACGRLFHTGTRVVLWSAPGGFDAYRAQRRFGEKMLPSHPVGGANTPMRYSPMR